MGLCTGVLASVDAATERNAGRVEVDPGVRAWDAIVGRVAVGGRVARVTRVRRSSGFMGLGSRCISKGVRREYAAVYAYARNDRDRSKNEYIWEFEAEVALVWCTAR